MKRDMVIYYDSHPGGLGILRLAVNEGDDVYAHAHDEAKHRRIQNFSVMAWELKDDARAAAKRLKTDDTGNQAFVERRSAELRMERDYGQPSERWKQRKYSGREQDYRNQFLNVEWANNDAVRFAFDPALGPDQTVVAVVHDEMIYKVSPEMTPFDAYISFPLAKKRKRLAEKKQALAAAYGMGPGWEKQYLAGEWKEAPIQHDAIYSQHEENKALPPLAGLGIVSDTFTGRLGNRWQP